MGVLKTKSTLTIAVWASILLHTAGFLGFELAFSNKRESFPKSEPRIINVVSLNTGQNKPIPVQLEIDKDLPGLVKEPSPAPQNLSNESIEKEQVPEALTVNNAGTAGLENQTAPVEPNFSIAEGTITDNFVQKDPVPVNDIKPDYPFRARKKGYEGEVVINVLVSKEGVPLSYSVIESSGYEDLDRAARETILSTIFYPGTVNGAASKSNLQIHIKFKLK